VLGIVNRNGVFATHLALPMSNLHAVPENVPDEVAVFTEPTAAALEIQEQLTVGPGDRVVVIGPGKLGHLVARTLAATGCDLMVVGRSQRPLEPLSSAGIRIGTAEEGEEDEDREKGDVAEAPGRLLELAPEHHPVAFGQRQLPRGAPRVPPRRRP
jgi:threonine dehydrogenase-like Zn-dependent dehydrogenase